MIRECNRFEKIVFIIIFSFSTMVHLIVYRLKRIIQGEG